MERIIPPLLKGGWGVIRVGLANNPPVLPLLREERAK